MNNELWEKTVKEHGHECAGVALGFRVGEELKKIFDKDEQVICVSSLKNCVADGIRIVAGLSIEEGTLRYDSTVEGVIFYALDDDEGWQFKFKTLEIAKEADPVLLILASQRDMLYSIEPCDAPLARA